MRHEGRKGITVLFVALAVVVWGVYFGTAATAGSMPASQSKIEGWPQYYGSPDHNNYRKVKNKIRVPEILWKIDRASVPAALGEDVYATGESLRLVDLKTGEIKASWKQEGFEEKNNFFGTPVILEDRVIAHSMDGKVYALDRALTELLWSVEVPGVGVAKGMAYSSGVCDGTTYVVPAGSTVVALEIEDGSERWSFKLGRQFPVGMTPAIAGGKVLFGAYNSIFYALHIDSGEEIWTYEGDRPFGTNDPVVVQDKVFVGNRGGIISALDLKKGTLLWKFETGVTGLSTPGIVPGNVIVGFSKFVGTFDQKTGKPDPKGRSFKTSFNPFGSPTLVGDTLYFGNLDGHLYAYEYKNGQYKWSFELDEEQQVHSFVYHQDILLVSTTEGIFALGNDKKRKKLPKSFVLMTDDED